MVLYGDEFITFLAQIACVVFSFGFRRAILHRGQSTTMAQLGNGDMMQICNTKMISNNSRKHKISSDNHEVNLSLGYNDKRIRIFWV